MADTRKTVNLEEKHIDWLEDQPINFSAWVRAKINEEMNNKVTV